MQRCRRGSLAMRMVLVGLLVALVSWAGCRKRDARIDMTEYVMIYPGSPIVELPARSTTMTVKVRNVSENKLTRLRLQVKSEACAAVIAPQQITELIPGERKAFTVELTRHAKKPRQRYPLQLTLHGDGLPVPAGLDLMVDTGPPADKGWIDVGQVTLIHKEQTRTTYYILAGVPLLLLLGWLLWRWSRPERRQKKHD